MQKNENLNILRKLAGAILPVLLAMAGILILVRCGNALGWLPPVSVSAHSETTILEHQSLASRTRNPAKVVLLGDSTCLLGVDALALSRDFPEERVLNLALVIWFDLSVYGDLLADFAKTNPGQLEAVVLLVSPGKAAGGMDSGGEAAPEVWRQIRLGDRRTDLAGAKTPADWLGITLLREKIIAHLLYTPLEYTPSEVRGPAIFGFTSQVDNYMTAHQGSCVEPDSFLPVRRRITTIWAFSPGFASESRDFKSKIPAGVKLIVGFTPIPKIACSPDARESRDKILQEWGRVIGADVVLTNLPICLPNVYFSRTSHLNELGQKKFTGYLAQSLDGILGTNSAIGVKRSAREAPAGAR